MVPGHRTSSAVGGRFPAEEEARVADELRNQFASLGVRIGFGSLAAGADILAAEALLDLGAELQVVLPFERDEFVRVSVAPAGEDRVERFERCLAAASRSPPPFGASIWTIRSCSTSVPVSPWGTLWSAPGCSRRRRSRWPSGTGTIGEAMPAPRPMWHAGGPQAAPIS
jgi:hypothetical protein